MDASTMDSTELSSLLHTSDAEFERTVQQVPASTLILLVQHLQKEMLAEQARFDSIFAQLQGGEGRREELVASHTRLSWLFQRHKRCFLRGVGPHEQQVRADTDQSSVLSSPPDKAAAQQKPDEVTDELVQFRVTNREWDPSALLRVLYAIEVDAPPSEPASPPQVTMEGWVERLPPGKGLSTLLKTWKRRMARCEEGILQLENERFPLLGASVEELGEGMLGIHGVSGHTLVLRCAPGDLPLWLLALRSQSQETTVKERFVVPLPRPPAASGSGAILLLDLGACSTRAGVYDGSPSLPSLFLPSVVACTPDGVLVGVDALRPSARSASTVLQPVRNQLDALRHLVTHVSDRLGIRLAGSCVVASLPQSRGPLAKHLLDLLLSEMGCRAVAVLPQSLLALLAYGSETGIVVSLGERLDVVPIKDLVVLRAGVRRSPLLGPALHERLNALLTQQKGRLFGRVETLLVRLVLEKCCRADEPADGCPLDLAPLQLHDAAAPPWVAPETRRGPAHVLFDPSLAGKDEPGLHKLIQSSVLSVDVDLRKEMLQHIFLAGGVSLLPGLDERLARELAKLFPGGTRVHASPGRYHAAFIGASIFAQRRALVDSVTVTQEEWKVDPGRAMAKVPE